MTDGERTGEPIYDGPTLEGRESTRNPRALVADDSAVNQMIAVVMLNRLGYVCDVAENGTEALEAASRTGYDVILMDVHMPEMDGYEATARIRERRGAGVPIIAMTADALEEDREKALSAGMDDYISKPMKEKDLEAVLSRRVGRRTPLPDDIVSQSVLNRLREIGGREVVREMTAAFLEETMAHLAELRDSANRSDSPAIRRATHKLKGSAATMGATRLSRLVTRIETKSDDMPFVRGLLDDLDEEFSATKAALISEVS